MDMDIPMPDELEWLEANSHQQEEKYEYFEPPEPYPEYDPPPEEEQPKQPLKEFEKASSPTVDRINTSQSAAEALINKLKRTRTEDEVVLESLDEKRGRFEDAEEDDEDWLRYSEPREIEEVNVVEEFVEEEKFVSRFASEIDGEFIPVTGFDGDRVYAKICRSDRVGRLRKLDGRARDGGGNVL